jgi:hypothetical protein
MRSAYSKVSLVELDDVCHNNGAAMYDAIRRYQIKVWLWSFDSDSAGFIFSHLFSLPL